MLNDKVKECILSLKRPITTNYIDSNSIDYNNRAVTFTRVSTNKQLKNLSLKIQFEAIDDYATRQQLTIVERFGGTNESAKDTNGKEFNRMLRYVKTPSNKINNILVFNFSRFSRSGDENILTELRKKYRIQVIDVTSPMIVKTPMDAYFEKMRYTQGWVENEMRKENIVRGMIAKLNNGYWPCKSPIGYTSKVVDGVRISVPDEKAKYIKLAFEKRANENMPLNEIAKLLTSLGFKTNIKALSQILMNPFYCGVIQHGLIGKEKLIIGKHEPLISQKTFFQCNGKTKHQPKKTWEELPLKEFALCGCCGKPLTGYRKLKNRSYYFYYKCNTPKMNCESNKPNSLLHTNFASLLKNLSIHTQAIPIIKKMVLRLYNERHDILTTRNKECLSRKETFEKQLETAEIRFATGEIDRGIYQKAATHIHNQLQEVMKEIEKTEIELSNFNDRLERGLQLLKNLDVIWESSSLEGRRKLQNALFPGGITLDQENTHYRTDGLNEFVAAINRFTSDYDKNKKRNDLQKTDHSSLVVPTGIEPVSKV